MAKNLYLDNARSRKERLLREHGTASGDNGTQPPQTTSPESPSSEVEKLAPVLEQADEPVGSGSSKPLAGSEIVRQSDQLRSVAPADRVPQFQEEAVQQTVYMRPVDNDRLEHVLAFMRANRRFLRTRRRGLTAVVRAALELIESEIVRDPDTVLAALNRALPLPTSRGS